MFRLSGAQLDDIFLFQVNVLIVSPTFPPEVGAAPSRIYNMAMGLRKAGAHVDVLGGLPNYPKGEIFEEYKGRFSKKEDVDGITTYRYWTYATNSKKPMARLLSMFSLATTILAFGLKVRKIKAYDLVIIQSPTLPVATSAIILFKKVFGKKVIANISDIWPDTAVELGAMKKGSRPYRVMAWMERFIYKNSDAHQGQSNEICEHIKSFGFNKPSFLYRNLQHSLTHSIQKNSRKPFKIVYAGLLGVAQDILGLIKNIDFRGMGTEFHLYGSGNQVDNIKKYINSNDVDVFYHGTLPKEQMVEVIAGYNASIVPLIVRIHGAVPSKTFDLMPLGVPILFCGGGEGAQIVRDYKVGLTSPPGDYVTLASNITTLINMSDNEYEKMRQNCIDASVSEFSFENQMGKYIDFVSDIVAGNKVVSSTSSQILT